MSDLLSMVFTADFLGSVIRMSTPILFVALAALVGRKADVLCIAYEGIMLFAAFGGVVGSAYTGTVTGGLLLGILLGMFLIGAYQEILGDLHNLFGDTHAVHVSLAENGYSIDHIQEGDTVTDVLGYVQFQRPDLMQRMRQAIEKALRDNLLSIEESALLMSRYAQGLGGYTYLEEKPTPEPGSETLTIVRTEPRANGGAKPRQPARGKTSA